MIDVGLPEPVAKDNAALAVAWMADGDCDYVTDDVRQILGRPAASFERFAVVGRGPLVIAWASYRCRLRATRCRLPSALASHTASQERERR